MKKFFVFLSILLGLLMVAPVIAQGWSVALWYGDPDDLTDSGWQVCDGTNGTPDLRDQFVVGAGDSYDLGDTGGVITNSLEHRHQVESHRHTITPTTAIVEGWTPAQPVTVVQTLAWTGYESPMTDYQLTGDTENRPPYLATYYICYSGTMAVSAVITDPMTTDYWLTEEGTAFSRVRSVTTGEEITNYLLIAILALVGLQFTVKIITEVKRKWN